MTDRRRVLVFVAIAVVCTLIGGTYIAFAAVRKNSEGSPTTTEHSFPTSPVVAFRDESNLESEGSLSWQGFDGKNREMSNVRCERLYLAARRGICLAHNANKTGFVAQFLDGSLRRVGEVPLAGIPSRARVSSDGKFASSTVFVLGHSYADGQFSTETAIYDLESATKITTLEQFSTYNNGQRVDAPDVNYWGVTFKSDSNQFYATVSTGGTKYLVEGNVIERRMTVLKDNVECPSLSPDGTRIAYKKAVGNSSTMWRMHVLDLATMQDTSLSETRSIDDQIEWLDNQSVLYGVVERDVYKVSADGSGKPELFINDASSPSVQR